MVQGIPALLATLGALAATGLLILRARQERLPYLIAWCLTMGGVSVALVGMTLGFLAGFGGFLFRLMEVGGALVAPVWLALGMAVLVTEVVQLRFASWLFGISYSVVAVVILLLDPLKGSFDKSLPDPGRHYDSLPLLLIDLAHGVAVLALVACLVMIALRAGKQDREAYALLMPVALVALAGVLVVSGTRGFLPGVLAVLSLAGAAGLIWFGVTRMLPEPEADEGDYDEEYDADYGEHAPADQGYEVRTGYDDQIHAAPADPAATQIQPPAHARPAVPPPAQPPMAPPGMPGPRLPTGERPLPGEPPGRPPAAPLCGRITVYTLMDGRGGAFDRLAGEAVRAAREIEPDTLIFTCHEVPGAPSQRIVYQLFRDQAAYAGHQRMPHVQRFAAESRPYVAATNVIELNLTAAKVVPLPAPIVQDYP
jgi:quinol monooxygenase YgiN